MEDFVSVKVDRIPRHSAKKTDFMRLIDKAVDQALNSLLTCVTLGIDAYRSTKAFVFDLSAEPV